MPYSVSIIIPAFNEEKAIGGVLRHIIEVMDTTGFEYEIIVVDDGSRDETTSKARQFQGVVVTKHRRNLGYGAALKTGIRRARFDTICITDADGTYPNEQIPHLVKTLMSGDFSMAVGARTGKNVAIPIVRRPAKWAIGRLANILSGETIPDLNSGLRAFNRETALRFFNLLPDGFSFTTTITLCMLTNGYSVEYVPIDYHPRVGKSKIKPIRDTLNFTQLILRIALYFAPLKIFLPISGILFLAAVTVGYVSHYLTGRVADVTTLVIAMAALQVAITGFLAELINRRVPSYYRNEETK
jgi:glycosyltransferase involved in cell wall biosynthesis